MTLADRYTFGDREHLALRMAPCIAPALRESESDKHLADADEEPQVPDIGAAAKAYLDAGYEIVPLLPGKKKIVDEGWQKRFYTLDDVKPDSNLGLKCVPTVVDIDCLLALKCADDLLPTTYRIDGRPGKPRSHRGYVAEVKAEDFKHLDGTMIVQILAGRGEQAVVPPPLWVDDENPQHQERRAWVDGSLIGPRAAKVDGPFLRTRVVHVATVALMGGMSG
jgi:hypothetical protein